MRRKINILKDDITTMKVDVIVNAANTSLLGGGGVDGAIHRAAGPELLEECKTLNGCPTGEAKLTKGYSLPAKFIIHTVGPIWKGGFNLEENQLENCYLNSLRLADKHQCTSIAFPNISTGVYRFPKDKAAHIAIKTVKTYLKSCKYVMEVNFICFDDENFHIYQQNL